MHRPVLTSDQVRLLAHILDHLSDHVYGDDRPDHGLNVLAKYRDVSPEMKREISRLFVKMQRVVNKLQ